MKSFLLLLVLVISVGVGDNKILQNFNTRKQKNYSTLYMISRKLDDGMDEWLGHLILV